MTKQYLSQSVLDNADNVLSNSKKEIINALNKLVNYEDQVTVKEMIDLGVQLNFDPSILYKNSNLPRFEELKELFSEVFNQFFIFANMYGHAKLEAYYSLPQNNCFIKEEKIDKDKIIKSLYDDLFSDLFKIFENNELITNYCKVIFSYILNSLYKGIYEELPINEEETAINNDNQKIHFEENILEIRQPLPQPSLVPMFSDKLIEKSTTKEVVHSLQKQGNKTLQVTKVKKRSNESLKHEIVAGIVYELEEDGFIDSNDIAICNALSGAFMDGYNTNKANKLEITPLELWKRIHGHNYNARVYPSEKQINELLNSINKMRTTLVTLDLRQEDIDLIPTLDGEKFNKKYINKNLLEADIIGSKSVKSKELLVIRIKSEPILCWYSRALDNFIYLPLELFKYQKQLNVTPKRDKILKYIIFRLTYMHLSSKNISNRILLKTIYEETNEPTPEEKANQFIGKDKTYIQSRIRDFRRDDKNDILKLIESLQGKYITTNDKPIKIYESFNPVFDEKGKFIGIDFEIKKNKSLRKLLYTNSKKTKK